MAAGTQSAPRYWDLLLAVFVLLAAIGGGNYYLYQFLLAEKARRAAAAAPPPPPPVPVAEPAPPVEAPPAPAPVAEPVPAPAAKAAPAPKPYAQKIRSRSQAGRGQPITYVVQGTDRARMLQEVALDAFLASFYDTELVDPLDGASKKTRSTWADWVASDVAQISVDTDARGIVVTYRADLLKIRKTLEEKGIAFSPIVPSFGIETNGSYATDDDVIGAINKALKRDSPYFIGAAVFAPAGKVEKEIGKLRVELDGEPFTVQIVKNKDLGASAVGQTILYGVKVLPAR